MLTLAAISFAARVLTGKDITWNKGDIWVVIAYAAWGFVHFADARRRAEQELMHQARWLFPPQRHPKQR